MKTTWTGANPPNTISPPPPPPPPLPLLPPLHRFMDSCHKIYTVLDLKQAWEFFPLLVEWVKVWRRGQESFLQSLWCCEGQRYGTRWQNTVFCFRRIIMMTVELWSLEHSQVPVSSFCVTVRSDDGSRGTGAAPPGLSSRSHSRKTYICLFVGKVKLSNYRTPQQNCGSNGRQAHGGLRCGAI